MFSAPASERAVAGRQYIQTAEMEAAFLRGAQERRGDIRHWAENANRTACSLAFISKGLSESLCLGRLHSVAWSTRIPAPTPGQQEGSASTPLAGDSTRECAVRDRDAPFLANHKQENNMSKSEPDEVQVLRFFERGPIDKVEAVFNIVSEKMRERLRESHGNGHNVPEQTETATRKRSSRITPAMPSEPGVHSGPAHDDKA
jgi:hypothetical protein